MTIVFPRAGRQFEREAGQFGVGVAVRVLKMPEEPFCFLPLARRRFREPNDGFYGLDLAKEGPNAAESMRSPMPEQAGGFRRDAPLVGRQVAPPVDLPAYAIDNILQVLLVAGFQLPRRLVERQRRLFFRDALAFSGLGDGRNEIGGPAMLDDFLGRLSRYVQFPMAIGPLVRRIEDRLLEEKIAQNVALPKPCML